jgi:hypothetical protein
MSRSTTHATDLSTRVDLDSDEQTTRPLPTVTPFDLEAEVRRLDALACAADEADNTLMIDPEENKRLLASAFALGGARDSRHPQGDEPTMIALRAPQLFLVPPVAEIVEEPPETTRILIAVPRAAVPSPPSGPRPRVTPDGARITRDLQAYEAARAAPRPAPRAASTWLPRGASETWVVVAIWATALSLVALLGLMVWSV